MGLVVRFIFSFWLVFSVRLGMFILCFSTHCSLGFRSCCKLFQRLVVVEVVVWVNLIRLY